MRQQISTHLAPAAIGPYSQAIRVGDLLFVSGQVPVDPATGQFVPGDISTQARRPTQWPLFGSRFHPGDIVKPPACSRTWPISHDSTGYGALR